jgi:Ethanolamine utilization protein EutJ (predicted chaperonin)
MPELFNPIGEKVEKVAPAAAPNGTAAGEEERVVEEIESLCMNCEENVSRPTNPSLRLEATDRCVLTTSRYRA